MTVGMDLVRRLPPLPGTRPEIWMVSIALPLFLLLGTGRNFGLALLAVITLFVGIVLLWRPKEPPMLLFVFIYQWLQASTNIVLANLDGISVDQATNVGGNQVGAVSLLLVALILLAIGIRLGAGDAQRQARADWRQSETGSISRWAFAYLVGLGFSIVAVSLVTVLPALVQPIGVVGGLRWVAYFGITYLTFSRSGTNKVVWGAIFAFEFLSSFGGYFSSFKEVFIYTMLALVVSGVRVSRERIALGTVLAGFALLLGVVWTAIKSDYRDYASGAVESQVVVVTRADAMSFIVERASVLSYQDLSDAGLRLLNRISYNDYFGVVLDMVPNSIEHSNGALWRDAVVRVFTPRIFFPDKGVLDDSLRTNQYTLLEVAGSDQGTSISLGYIAETYIDFGRLLMMPVLLAWGWVLGRVYRHFATYKSPNRLIAIAFIPYVIAPVTYLETSLPKVVGGLALSVLICMFVLSLLQGRLRRFASVSV